MKYQTELCSIANCPSPSCTNDRRKAYRFVFNPINTDSFLPQGIKKPSRGHKEISDDEKCSLLALSMFISEKAACKRYEELRKKIKNIGKTLGSHLAEGVIQPHHGVMSQPNSKGHFDFFESSGVDLTKDFNVISNLDGKL